MPIRKYIKKRWNIFSEATTLHGVKEIRRAPIKTLKLLWLTIVMLSGTMMFYQIYKLTAHYLKEPITTTVGVKNEPYEMPLLLLVSSTGMLFSPDVIAKFKAQQNRFITRKSKTDFSIINDEQLDFESFTYLRSLVEDRLRAPSDFNFNRARLKFERYLLKHNYTWYDVLKPLLVDITPWIESSGKLKVLSTSSWNVATYYRLEGNQTREHMLHGLNHDMLYEVALNWENLPGLNTAVTGGKWAAFVLTSYGLLTDAVRYEPGRIIKLRYDITAHRRTPLRRRPCRQDTVRFSMYDELRCTETCLLRSQQRFAPRKCYMQNYTSWAFYEAYKWIRPCSYGVLMQKNDSASLTGENYSEDIDLGRYYRESDEIEPGGNEKKADEDFQACLIKECSLACEELSIKFSSSSHDFDAELKNESLLYINWPAPNAVAVYEVDLQYTWDGFVGQLGGLVGLWMGASMMSVCEAFYLCCCCCFDVRAPEHHESNGVDGGESASISSAVCGRTSKRRRTTLTSMSAKSVTRRSIDEENKYGNDYGAAYTLNGNYYTEEELTRLKLPTTTWTLDETSNRC